MPKTKPQRTRHTVEKPPKIEWECRTKNQELLKESIEKSLVTFAIGCSGAGKSFVSIYTLIDLLLTNKATQLTVSRPLVTCGEDVGYLPGPLDEKLEPFLGPMFDIIYGHPVGQFLIEGEHSPLRVEALGFMRGTTFNSLVFIDEGANINPHQMEMILTRMGKDGKLVIAGDISQSDLKKGQSGLAQAVGMFKDDPDVGVVEFTIEDIQRSDFVGRAITKYYEERNKSK